MKIVGIGTVLPAGTVTKITKAGVEMVYKNKKAVYAFADVEKMVGL